MGREVFGLPGNLAEDIAQAAGSVNTLSGAAGDFSTVLNTLTEGSSGAGAEVRARLRRNPTLQGADVAASVMHVETGVNRWGALAANAIEGTSKAVAAVAAGEE